MIIESLFELKVGKIYNQDNFPPRKDGMKASIKVNKEFHETFTFYVIRKCTVEEYINGLREAYGDDIAEPVCNNFYEISVD